jgi:hypothetical protein
MIFFLKIVHFKNGVDDFCYFARPPLPPKSWPVAMCAERVQ